MKSIRVAAAVICSQEVPARVFATARGYGPCMGMWEFPGGKLQGRETSQEALKREIWEELEAQIQVGEKIKTVEYDYPEFHVSMDCFWCRLIGDHLVLKEAMGSMWLSRDQLWDLDWLPADRMVLEEIEEGMELLERAENPAVPAKND